MKKFILLTLTALMLSVAANAAAKKMTVKDYFMAIPAEYVKADAKKRISWIELENAKDGYLSYEIPIAEFGGTEGAKVFGSVQVFDKKKGGVVVGLTTNLCEEGICLGSLLLLDYANGKWSDRTDALVPEIDNDEIIRILKNAPSYDQPLKEGSEVPLYMSFNGTNKLIEYTAGGTNGDGGTVAKMFKWNGEKFVAFEYAESP